MDAYDSSTLWLKARDFGDEGYWWRSVDSGLTWSSGMIALNHDTTDIVATADALA